MLLSINRPPVASAPVLQVERHSNAPHRYIRCRQLFQLLLEWLQVPTSSSCQSCMFLHMCRGLDTIYLMRAPTAKDVEGANFSSAHGEGVAAAIPGHIGS
jgi:hypothetical protein